MRWTHKIYIVTPLLLQGQHNTGQIAVRNFLAAALMADVEVLTEQTHQVAMGEKNRAGAMPAHERILLPKMGIGARNPGRFSGITCARFTRKSVDTAFSGTKNAGMQQVIRFFYFTYKMTSFKGFDI